jgi:hypothetical protein
MSRRTRQIPTRCNIGRDERAKFNAKLAALGRAREADIVWDVRNTNRSGLTRERRGARRWAGKIRPKQRRLAYERHMVLEFTAKVIPEARALAMMQQ